MIKMETLRIVYLLLFFCLHTIICFPTKPLNERSTELAWQAWLLVDDQNQNKHYDTDSLTRRRITPKSVFIAPTFSPESLPACADGYRPDPMGRCIKIIKLDEEAHLDFLLEKLNAQFGNYDEVEDESQEDVDTGPFQVNIPLNGVDEEQGNDGSEDLDIAIVVAPTNGIFGLGKDVKDTIDKTNVLNSHSQTKKSSEAQDRPPQENSSDVPKIENKFALEETTVSVDPTTTTEIPTTIITTTTTITEEEEEMVSSPTTTTLSVETTNLPNVELETTTINPEHALFFLQPTLNNTKHVQNGTNNAGGTPVIESSHNVISNHSLTTRLSNSTFTIDATININNKHHLPVNLKQEQEIKIPNSDDLITSENFHRSGFVRFPTEDETRREEINYPEKLNQNLLPYLNYRPPNIDNTKNIADSFLNSPPVRNLNSKFKFEDYPTDKLLEELESDPEIKHQLEQDQYKSDIKYKVTRDAVFNRRNRDKQSSLWSLPPSFINSSQQKPILLRFSGRNVNSRQLLAEHLRPHTESSQAFYREFPTEDFSYIFGVSQNHRRNRR